MSTTEGAMDTSGAGTSGAGHVGLDAAGVRLRADGLRVVHARMADGARMLCVHNTGSEEARFDLDELASDELGSDELGSDELGSDEPGTHGVRPRFAGGAMRTSESLTGGIVCHLDAGGHVCLTLSPESGAAEL